MAKPPKNHDERSPKKPKRIREATLKRLWSTPPETHEGMLDRKHRFGDGKPKHREGEIGAPPHETMQQRKAAIERRKQMVQDNRDAGKSVQKRKTTRRMKR